MEYFTTSQQKTITGIPGQDLKTTEDGREVRAFRIIFPWHLPLYLLRQILGH